MTTTKAREQLLVDWVTALRSGKYKQAHSRLRVRLTHLPSRPVYGYCCLGVACDLDLKQRNKRWTCGTNYHSHPVDNMVDVSDSMMTTDLRNTLGLTIDNVMALVQLNDEDHASFSEIADYIESTVMPAALTRL